MLAFAQKVLETILTRDGAWAALAIVLMSCMGYLYFGEIKIMRAQLNRVEYVQLQTCLRTRKPNVDPSTCWTFPPDDVILKAISR